MDFQSYSLGISYRISIVVHRGCVDIFWNSPIGLQKSDLRPGLKYQIKVVENTVMTDAKGREMVLIVP